MLIFLVAADHLQHLGQMAMSIRGLLHSLRQLLAKAVIAASRRGGVGLEDAADNSAALERGEVVLIPSPDGREADVRLRMR